MSKSGQASKRPTPKSNVVAIVPLAAASRCQQTMALRCLELSDPWSVRNLTICVRQFSELPLYARQLVDHLKA